MHLCLWERGNCVPSVTSDIMMELLTVFALLYSRVVDLTNGGGVEYALLYGMFCILVII